MKKVKFQIKSVFGEVLFEYEAENNTLRKTIEKAVNSSANLRSADLRCANLRSANLRYADLRYADLKKFYHLFTIVPQEGSFIAWKSLNNGCIAKIEIPAKAKRVSHLASRKCRASYVKTLAIYDRNGNEIKEACGRHDNNTTYKVGRLTKPDKYDPSPLVDCSGGIHFFLTKEEALEW